MDEQYWGEREVSDHREELVAEVIATYWMGEWVRFSNTFIVTPEVDFPQMASGWSDEDYKKAVEAWAFEALAAVGQPDGINSVIVTSDKGGFSGREVLVSLTYEPNRDYTYGQED